MGSPIIWGNIIEYNENGSIGAGILSLESNFVIRSNIIRDNWSCSQGAGIEIEESDQRRNRPVTIEGNLITGNRAGWCINDRGDGAGVSTNAPCVIRYNMIAGNRASKTVYYASGAGLNAVPHYINIYNNTIVNNAAGGGPPSGHGRGGGVYLGFFSPNDTGFIENNIIAFNPWGGGAFGQIGESTCFIWDYNLVFGNDSANFIGIPPGPHDIQADPMFIDTAEGDYHLHYNSPCIDAGDPAFPPDPDGTRADIGAYYFDQSVGIDGEDAPPSPFGFTLRQNYPNPFNGQTIVSYYLNEESVVSLHIYAITGHLISPLVNRVLQNAGEHSYTWEGRDSNGMVVSTGIYFYELYVNKHRESKAMILVK